MTPFVSIIIPTVNEAQYIAKVLDSLLTQSYDSSKIEVIVVDGRSTDTTRKILSEYEKTHNNIRLVDNPEKIVPYAMNYGIEHARGEIIVRMDAHSKYPKNYIEVLVSHLQSSGADNVGGVWKMVPAKDTVVARAIAVSNSSGFGIGNSAYRFDTDTVREVDTVPFGCYRRDVFERIGLFDTDLVRNQDDELNMRLKQHGGKTLLIPNISIDYVTRPTLAKMSKMFYQYGLYKPLANKKLGGVSTLRQLAPPLFVLAVLLFTIASFYSKTLLIMFISLGLVYVVFSWISGLKYAEGKRRFLVVAILPVVFFLIHSSYGIGFVQGLLNTHVKGFRYQSHKMTVSR